MDIDEAELVARVIAGDRLAFARLVEPETPRLLATCMRLLGSKSETEDAMQNALASLWIMRARLDPARSVAPILTTISLNKCRDRLRRRKAAQFLGFGREGEGESVGADTPSPETEAADRDALRRTREAIARLPVRLREALVLVAIDGRSQREAAELLSVSEKAIETRIYRARKILKKTLALE